LDLNHLQKDQSKSIDIAFFWDETDEERILSFTNNIFQIDGGAHLFGMRSIISKIILPYVEAEISKGKTKAKFAMAASVVLAAVGGTWLYQNSQNQTSSDAELLADIQKVSDVKPVFSNTDVAFKHLVVNTEKGANFKLPNGTKIVVPQDAFVDKNNKPIVGNVDLEYREFHNAAQIGRASCRERVSELV
jgi:hypothetical protein